MWWAFLFLFFQLKSEIKIVQQDFPFGFSLTFINLFFFSEKIISTSSISVKGWKHCDDGMKVAVLMSWENSMEAVWAYGLSWMGEQVK